MRFHPNPDVRDAMPAAPVAIHAADANRGPVVTRRDILRSAALAVLIPGILGGDKASAQETQQEEEVVEAEAPVPQPGHYEHAEHHDSPALAALDGFGTAAFVDAMKAVASQEESMVQKIGKMVGWSTAKADKTDHAHDGHGHEHEHTFPFANISLAAALNIVRASAFGHEVREHTVHEFKTTLTGLLLLTGLTSFARGIVKTGHAVEMATEGDAKSPEETLGDTIVQLTAISAATQIPLSSFGNAAVGNAEFKQVDHAFKRMYYRLLPGWKDGKDEKEHAVAGHSFEELAAHVTEQCGKYGNPVITKRVTALLDKLREENPDMNEHDLRRELRKEARSHTRDLMTILMATACDDTQAAAGDPGPLIGLYQTVGSDFLHAVPSLAPYTALISVERALFAAQRAGLDKKTIFTKERMEYMRHFLVETWRNLVLYFASVAPNISSKITGKNRVSPEKKEKNTNGSMNFSLVEQVFKDIEDGANAGLDAVLGSLNEGMLDRKKILAAIGELQKATGIWKARIGNAVAGEIYPKKAEETVVTKEAITDMQNEIVGAKSQRNVVLQDMQIDLAKLAADPDLEAIDEFAAAIAAIREDKALHTELEHAIRELREEIGDKPSVATIANILAKNPRIRDLVDFNYWHKRIGPALTDTMFVVLLQGLHLPFLVNTAERVMYNAEWFKKMPLKAQEWTSIVFNYGGGMFADNWAICIAQVKWMTTIYFNQLDAKVKEMLEEHPYPDEVRQLPQSFRDDVTKLAPERFRAKAEWATALVDHLKRNYSGSKGGTLPTEAQLDAFLEKYLQDAETYYHRAVVASMLNSVTGAGQSLIGDSTHFTFAAGEKDFTLAETLDDFRRHPLYHLWELLFMGGYALHVGPAIAQHVVHPALSATGVGSKLHRDLGHLLQGEKLQGRARRQFMRQFPGFEQKLRELEKKEALERKET